VTEPDGEFLALCMCPGAFFSSIADEVNSVVLASGTLNLSQRLDAEFGMHFKYIMSAPHVVSHEQVAAFTINEGAGGLKLTSAHAHLKDGHESVEGRLAIHSCRYCR